MLPWLHAADIDLRREGIPGEDVIDRLLRLFVISASQVAH